MGIWHSYVCANRRGKHHCFKLITYETEAFVQKNILQAQLEKNPRQTSPLQCVRWVQVCHMNVSVALWWLYCLKQQFTVMNNCSNYSWAFWLVTNKLLVKVLFLYVTWTEYLSLLHAPTIFSVHLSFQHSVKLLPRLWLCAVCTNCHTIKLPVCV